MAKTYDAIMRSTERRCLADWRREILADARGELLEIGAGTGLNLPFYSEQTNHIILSEPDAQMRRQLERKVKRHPRRRIDIIPSSAEQIDLPDASIDGVVSTLVLCSVACPTASLQEISRLLRPGGTLHFMEHIVSDRPHIRRWQQRLQPLWSFCAGDCQLSRNTAVTIRDAGLHIEWVTEDAMCGAPAFVNRTIRGVARKPL